MGHTKCCLGVELRRGAWTPEEDLLLTKYMDTHGEGNWMALPQKAGLQRCGKSCRLRWMNYLRPNVKRGNISQDEKELIIRMHRLLGNRWALIAGRLPGRTDNEIKNYWNTQLSKKLSRKRPHTQLSDCNPSNHVQTVIHYDHDFQAKPEHDSNNNIRSVSKPDMNKECNQTVLASKVNMGSSNRESGCHLSNIDNHINPFLCVDENYAYFQGYTVKDTASDCTEFILDQHIREYWHEVGEAACRSVEDYIDLAQYHTFQSL